MNEESQEKMENAGKVTRIPTKKGKMSGEERSRLNELLAQVNTQYAVVEHGSHVFIMRHWLTEQKKSKLAFYAKRDFLLKMENQTFMMQDGEEKTKPVNIGKYWLTWRDRKEYDEVYFRPCDDEYENRYNLWQGFAVVPQENAGKFDKFLDHIHVNICEGNKEYYDWVMAWLADLVQKPWRKPGTAIVLRGEMGIGKGQFAAHIGKLLGNHFEPILQQSHVMGKFNSHMADKLLLFVDESFWDDSRNGAGILRGLITEQKIMMEMKGRDAIAVDSYLRLIIATNSDWVVPTGFKDERRFFVLDVKAFSQGNLDYFREIEEQLENGGYQSLLHYLKNYHYDDKLPRTIIHTEALLDQKLHSLPPHAKWWLDCLHDETIIPTTDGSFNWPESLTVNDFYKSYLKYMEDHQLKNIIPKSSLPKKLRGFAAFSKKRDYFGYKYEIQSLITARETFCIKLKHTLNWDDLDQN